MGDLRNSILELQKQVLAAAKSGDELAVQLEKDAAQAGSHFERFCGGVEVLWNYVDAMFDKNGRDIKAHMNDKLSEHSDSEITSYLTGIKKAAEETLTAIKTFETTQAKLPPEYARIDAAIATIRRNIEKKRSKLFNSKKYKAKLTTYDRALDEIVTAVEGRRKMLKDFSKKKTKTPQAVSSRLVLPSWKLVDVENAAGIGLEGALKQMKQEVEEGKYVGRKFHENGDLKEAFGTLKQWAGEADAMDQEVQNLDPNAVKPIKDVKIFSGSKLVGTAAKATFQGKRPMEIQSVTWQRGVNTLSLLQKPVRLEAKYVTGDGSFVHDMKVNGIKDTTLKLT